MADISGAGWRAAGISVTLDLASKKQPAGVVTMARLELAEPIGTLRDLRVHCPKLALRARGLACDDGMLQVAAPVVGERRLPMSLALAYDGSALDLQLPAIELSFDTADGTLAAERLKLALDLSLRARDGGWHFTVATDARGGQAYVDPVFMDFDAQPAQIQATGRWRDGELQVTHLQVDQPGVLQAQARLRLSPGAAAPLRRLAIDSFEARFPAAYNRYLQPFATGTVLGALTTNGRLTGALTADAAGLAQLELEGRGLELAAANDVFRILGGALDIDWARDEPLSAAPLSQLDWNQAQIYGIDLGAAAVSLRAAGSDFRLSEPARLPLLDGALVIDQMAGFEMGGTQPRLNMRARLTPIDLAELTTAFGWPALGGTLSGELPGLVYRDGALLFEGGLSAEVFDGQVAVTALRLEQLFGAHPRLTLDATGRQLDLKAATGAFSFGRIEGHLDADVTGLRLLDWRPVAFDAWLRTPADDSSRHRISQRAVDNLASLGGGGAGLVSRGFLRFFDDFAYARIGLGCRLRQNTCHMRGLAPAEDGGFVIVRGRWLPRIDVIGHNRQVSWPTLLKQLRQATAAEGPVIQ